MFRKLIVPLDGSDSAECALPYAVRLARAGQGGITLVQVAFAQPPMVVEGVDWGQDQAEALEDAGRYLRAIAERIADQVPVETVVVPNGNPALQILDQVRHLGADGIVMATHGRTGLAHLLYGSVAETVIAETAVPVFLVHARPGKPAVPSFDPLASRLMVPLDGSSFAEAALQLAFDLLGPAGELVLVTVVQPPDHVLRDNSGRVLAYLDQQAEAHFREGLCYLENVAHRLRQTHPDLHVSLDVRLDKPSTGIIAAAAERAVDLVVMATHGRTGLRRDAVGSVAGDVLRIGIAPLLLVRPVVEATARHGSPRPLNRIEAGIRADCPPNQGVANAQVAWP
jgi:nucleotide-binding universal stress UspA family protein